MRGAMILLLASGAGLVIYSVHERRGAAGRPANEPGTRSTPPPGAVNGVPIDTDTQGPSLANGAGPGDEAPAGTGPGDAGLPSMEDFEQPIRNAEGEQVALITGKEAIVDPKKRIYRILAPILTVYTVGEAMPVGDTIEQARVTAKRAVWDDQHGTVALEEDVAVVAEGYDVAADNALYAVRKRTITCEGPVRIRRLTKQRKPTAEGIDAAAPVDVPGMEAAGEGLSADLAVTRLTLHSGVVTRLFDVSGDFLRDGREEREGTVAGGDVVIQCDGALVYEHGQRRATFHENVRVEFGARSLRCTDRFTVNIGETDAGRKLHVTDVRAAGDAELRFEDTLARGETIEWRNVTQTAVLNGEPCFVETPQFRLEGRTLSLFRMSDGLLAEGPGKLHWRPGSKKEEDSPARDDVGDAALLRLRNNEPIEITWQGSMTRDATEHFALFEGRVVASQQASSLSCDTLRIHLDAGTGGLTGVLAEGNVLIRDRQAEAARDVACHRMEWDAEKSTVDLQAAQGRQLTITADRQTIISPRIVVNNARKTILAPAAGRLIVRAAETPEGDDEPPDIAVDWGTSALFQRGDDPVATFEGTAQAHRAGQTIGGDTVRVEFDGEMEPLLIKARGKAFIEVLDRRLQAGGKPGTTAVGLLPAGAHGDLRLTCEEISVHPTEKVISSPTAGTLAVLNQGVPGDTVRWSKSMRLELSRNVAEFEGDVMADTRDGVMTAQRVLLEFKDNPVSGRPELNHIGAEGGVEFRGKGDDPWKITSATAEIVFAGGSRLHQFIARQDVEVTDQVRSLRSAGLVLTFAQVDGEDKPVLSRALADKNVRIHYQGEGLAGAIEAGGERLEWERDTDIYVLTGDPAWYRRGALEDRNRVIRVYRPTGLQEEAAFIAKPGDRSKT